MTFMSRPKVTAYWEKLKDPRWQRRRLELMQRADFTCEHCGDSGSTLHVHHKIYHKGHEPWEYTDKELACLCDTCHEIWHMLKDHVNKLLVELSEEDIRAMLGYGKALLLDSGAETRCQFGSVSAIRSFSKYFGLKEKTVLGLRDQDLWVHIDDVRAAQAKRKGKR